MLIFGYGRFRKTHLSHLEGRKLSILLGLLRRSTPRRKSEMCDGSGLSVALCVRQIVLKSYVMRHTSGETKAARVVIIFVNLTFRHHVSYI